MLISIFVVIKLIMETMPESTLKTESMQLQHKLCARLGCSSQGEYPLTIIYVKKVGLFCEECRRELVEDGLVVESAEQR